MVNSDIKTRQRQAKKDIENRQQLASHIVSYFEALLLHEHGMGIRDARQTATQQTEYWIGAQWNTINLGQVELASQLIANGVLRIACESMEAKGQKTDWRADYTRRLTEFAQEELAKISRGKQHTKRQQQQTQRQEQPKQKEWRQAQQGEQQLWANK